MIPDALIIRPHHREAIIQTVAHFSNDPTILALIIGGSVAKQSARDDSDIDAIVVVTQSEYERRKAQNQLGFCDFTLFSYQGGYLDAKIVDESFLRDAAAFGSEPTRNAFVGAFIAFSQLEGLENLLAEIARYPEALRQERIDSFWAQIVLVRHYFWGEAERMNDAYLRTKCVADLVLYASRMILAHNRILFASHKDLRKTIHQAPEKPQGFERLLDNLLHHPTRENMEALCECVEGFTLWNFSADSYTRYIRDTEIAWRERIPPLSEA